MEYKRLSECADFSNKRTSHITFENYISTENMLPEKGGISIASSLPDVKSACKYEKNDILLSNIRPYFKKIWFANREGSCSNDVLVIKSKKGYDPKFIYYVLSDNNFFNYDTVTSKGTKMPRGTPRAIMKYLVPDIDIETQKRIADVLSHYDKLIENNNKRIKILEQMAENLYKEWFVRFRYPGHKNDEFDYQNPKGWIFGDIEQTLKPKKWHFGELRKIGEFVRGKNITADKMVEGDIPVISAGLSPSGMHNEANVFGKSLTISASGANAGYLMYHLDSIWAADCSYYQDDKNIWFVYNSLKFLQPVISNMQAGAAQPHVYPKHVNRISIMIPDKQTLEQFCNMVDPLYEQIRILKLKNMNLIKQRDLLLPRLMSGKIQVK